MPSDFLLPLFVLTLLANAILVAFAIRGMRRGQWDDDRPIGAAPNPPAGGSTLGSPNPAVSSTTGDERSTRDEIARDESPHGERARDELARAIATRRPADRVVNGSARSVDAEPAVETDSPSGARVANPVTDATGQPAKARKKVAPPPKPRATKRAAAGDPTATRSATEPRRGRRRFSLPPLDDDHEKVNRSIKSFLGGIEGAGPDDDAPDPPAADAPPPGAAPVGPTTVALIAVDGLPAAVVRNAATRLHASSTGDASIGGPTVPAADAHEWDAAAEALAMVERTLRAAARGSDVVTVGDHGRFRIVLPATGELAARAYLRRIRATIEPRLESAGRPMRLAVATATVLDEPLDQAVERAEDRLSIALASDRSPDGGASPLRRSDGSDDAPANVPARPRAAAD